MRQLEKLSNVPFSEARRVSGPESETSVLTVPNWFFGEEGVSAYAAKVNGFSLVKLVGSSVEDCTPAETRQKRLELILSSPRVAGVWNRSSWGILVRVPRMDRLEYVSLDEARAEGYVSADGLVTDPFLSDNGLFQPEYSAATNGLAAAYLGLGSAGDIETLVGRGELGRYDYTPTFTRGGRTRRAQSTKQLFLLSELNNLK